MLGVDADFDSLIANLADDAAEVFEAGANGAAGAELGAGGQRRLERAGGALEVGLVHGGEIDQVDAVDEDVVEAAGCGPLPEDLGCLGLNLAAAPLLWRCEEHLSRLSADGFSA